MGFLEGRGWEMICINIYNYIYIYVCIYIYIWDHINIYGLRVDVG